MASDGASGPWRAAPSTAADAADSTASAQRAQLLSGVRVLDLGRILAGPYCTMLLADMGADVIKVERPGAGDDTRSWGPPFLQGESAYFLGINRNKRSVAVDMKQAAGLDAVLRLAASADVLVENFVPGRLEKLGLTYERVAALNPRLVWCSITGFGPTGPYAQRAAYDVPVAALGGMLSITGHPDGPPAKPGVALTDVLTGTHAHGAILGKRRAARLARPPRGAHTTTPRAAALLARSNTGRGQRIDTSLLECQIASLINIGMNVLLDPRGPDAPPPKRWGSAHASVVPYQVFAAAGGDELVIAANSDTQWLALCDALGGEEGARLRADERFLTNAGRVAHRDEVIQGVADAVAHRPRSELLQTLSAAGLAVTPVNTVREALDDPQVRHRGMVTSLQGHAALGGAELPCLGFPVKYGAVPDEQRPRQAPPLLGQHTHEVLAAAGMEPELLQRGLDEGWLQQAELPRAAQAEA